MYLSLYCKGSKRVTQGFTVRGSWKPNRTAIYCPPHSYSRQRCVFLVLQCCSTGGPGAQLSTGWWLSLLHLITNWSPNTIGGGFPYHILSLTSLIPNSSGASRAPSAGLSLPHLISNFSGPQLTDFLSSQSYIIVQHPLNLWNGIFDRHQAEITVMQFRGNSLPVHQSMSVSWDFYLVPFHQPNPPTRSLSITGHWNVSLLSGASLWNGMFARAEGQNTTDGFISFIICLFRIIFLRGAIVRHSYKWIYMRMLIYDIYKQMWYITV